MADLLLAPRAALAGIAKAGHHGADSGAPGVVLREMVGVQLATVTARKGRGAALADAVRQRWQLELPTTPRRVGGPALAFAWAGPEQWLASAEDGSGPLDDTLSACAAGLASVTAQGDGRVLLRLSGPRARDVLAKGIGIDLHPRAFRAGDTALTVAAHIGVHLWQLDDSPTYEIAAFRSYAGSLYGWLVSAAEEFGIEVVPAP